MKQLIILASVLVISRLIGLDPIWTPFFALALIMPSITSNKYLGYLLPASIMFITDVYMSSMMFPMVYGCLLFNTFLATKITFINEISDLCEEVGADVQDVAKGVGLDGRIGNKFLHAGPGYGGSCFPKDLVAISNFAKQKGIKLSILDEVIKVNNSQIKTLFTIFKKNSQKLINNKILILGLAFKENTDDMRN